MPEAIMAAIKLTFRALVDQNLLKNVYMVRRKMSTRVSIVSYGLGLKKNNVVTLKTLEFGVYEAVSKAVTKCRVLHEMGLQPGIRTITALKLLDSERIRSAEKAVSHFVRQARRKNKLNKRKLGHDEEETPAYMAGMY
ncbi:hypothetical protein J6590_037833 [Homalodisca vitripennis]|nr:hypothetical protein J6590_037833 [Homalodisca vitripennis]